LNCIGNILAEWGRERKIRVQIPNKIKNFSFVSPRLDADHMIIPADKSIIRITCFLMPERNLVIEQEHIMHKIALWIWREEKSSSRK
jgi:hypothetical protein